jgi:hydroxypyruvate reductase
MPRSPHQLRRDALAIWHAGVDAVRSDHLVRQTLRVDGPELVIGSERIALATIGRIVVVGAGKAGAGMAAAVEEVLGPRLLDEKRVAGWINVPEDCVRPLRRIHLHAARPPGVNEPTPAGARGAEEILRLVESLSPQDLCLCLISGGGSALLPAPAAGITLEDKLAVTRHLSAAGANIQELNTVRKQLSRIKGGGLARACRAGRLVALVISDVLGDPLDMIASGPTVVDSSTPQAALEILERFHAKEAGVSPRVFAHLRERAGSGQGRPTNAGPTCQVTNLIIGNNATAVAAAGRKAVELGYTPTTASATQCEGPAEDVGRSLAADAIRMRSQPGPNAAISGGEPVVQLVDAARRGLGGRNQQLVLAALLALAEENPAGLVLLSGGTDGEDGPTDAAGAILDSSIVAAARRAGLDPAEHLSRNDAYHFFAPLDALIKTGPTHTNVCDVRVVLVDH